MHRGVVAAVWSCALLVSCTASRTVPPSSGPPPASAARTVVVASFNFSESSVVAEIYAQALEAAGIPVRRELALGPRELVDAALAQGLVDVVPEYLGSALESVDSGRTAGGGDAATVRDALADALAPRGLYVLTPAAAQDQNGFAMTRARAEALGVRTITDLRAGAGHLALGGPPECPRRPYCLLGLRSVYGIDFARFVPLADQAQERQALDQGVIDVAVMFTSGGFLAEGDLVLLDDDRHLQPPENLVPVVSARAIARVGSALVTRLDAVSAQLSESNLRFLNWRVEVEGRRPADEARGWLARHFPP